MVARDSHLVQYTSLKANFKDFTPCQLYVIFHGLFGGFLGVVVKVHIMLEKIYMLDFCTHLQNNDF
jgi:hypothetical protein